MAVFNDIIYTQLLLPIIKTFVTIPAYVAAPVVNILLLGVTLSILYQGLDTIRGAGGANPILDVIAKATRPMLVLMFAASLSAFTNDVRPFLEKDLLYFLINAGANAANLEGMSGSSSVYSSIFIALDKASNKQFVALAQMANEASRHIDPLGFSFSGFYVGWPIKQTFNIVPNFSPDMTGLVAYPMIGLLYVLVVVTAIIIALQAIFVTIGLNFVLAFGPLFIAMYAFEKTEKYASHWLDSVLKYIFSLAVLMILYTIGSSLLSASIEASAVAYIAQPKDIGALVTYTSSPFIIGAALAYIMSKADELARDLIGGQASGSGAFAFAAGAGLANAGASTASKGMQAAASALSGGQKDAKAGGEQSSGKSLAGKIKENIKGMVSSAKSEYTPSSPVLAASQSFDELAANSAS